MSSFAKSSRPAFSFFLHGHLPWVIHHGRWPHGAEWLFEAALATYLPLIAAGRRLRSRNIRGGIVVSISPVLAEQLAHPDFTTGFVEYLEERIRTSATEGARFTDRDDARLADLARHWESIYRNSLEVFTRDLGGDILAAFADLQKSKTIELATCGATHGYFPLLARDETIQLQVRLARATHQRRFGAPPSGMWLPEAAYRPAGWWKSPSDGSMQMRVGVEEFLGAEGIRYVVVDSALLTGGRAIGTYLEQVQVTHSEELTTKPVIREIDGKELDTRAAYWIARATDIPPEVACYIRDPGTGLQVWSKDIGYPGEPSYLEFHKKSEGGGHRYWQVTGPQVDLGDKTTYDPKVAAERIRSHADHFASLVESTLAGAPPEAVLVAPFDAELFGHWWHEGVSWLEEVIVRLHRRGNVELTLLGERLNEVPPARIVKLPEGSWGAGGGHHVWLNSEVEWTWKLVHRAEEEVWSLVERARRSANARARQVTTAALRQLLFLVASDWQFLMTTGSAVDYATLRLQGHAEEVFRLAEIGRKLLGGHEMTREEERVVVEAESRDDAFTHLASVVGLDESSPASASSDSPPERSSLPAMS